MKLYIPNQNFRFYPFDCGINLSGTIYRMRQAPLNRLTAVKGLDQIIFANDLIFAPERSHNKTETLLNMPITYLYGADGLFSLHHTFGVREGAFGE